MLCIPVSEKFYACYGFVQESQSVKRISCLFLCSFQSFEKPFIITKKNPIGTSKTSTSQAQIKFPMSTFWWLNMTCAMRGKKHEKLEDSHIYSSGLSTTRTTHYVQKANKNCDNLWFCPTAKEYEVSCFKISNLLQTKKTVGIFFGRRPF